MECTKIKNVSELLKRLEKVKYPIFVMPEENWYRANNRYYGFKELLILYPDGYLLRFTQDLGTRRF